MNKIIIPVVFMMLIATPVVAQYVQQTYVNVDANFLRSDPVIPQPGQNVNLYFIVNGVTSNQNPTPLQFQLVPSYPLELAPGEIGTVSFSNVIGNSSIFPIVLEFHLYVAPNATNGEYNAELRYSWNNWTSYNSITQNITVQNVATDFDIIEQDVTGNSVTLGISNIGANVANAVTMTIPDQSGFTVQGVNSNIIGNLNPGDFTLVSFTIIPKSSNNQLLVKAFYTDTTGTRREVDKTVQVTFTSATTGVETGSGTIVRRSSIPYLTIAYIIVAALVFFFIGRYIGKRHKK